jgi:flagellar basal-body rod protein FlgC
MPVQSVLDAAREGMNYERMRLDAASRNIASANVPVAAGQNATVLRVDGGYTAGASDFGRMVGQAPTLGEQPVDAREVYDPGHPLASEQGMVRYPSIDMVQEMTTLMTASRGYEANVRAFNFLRSMQLRAIEIGAK